MPHTTRRNRRQASKRVQVTDEDGWTTVATTNVPQKSQTQKLNRNIRDPQTLIAHPDPSVTIDKLRQQYARQEHLWLQSEACQALTLLLQEAVRPVVAIDKLIIFGSGSTCGGWRRHDVALTQLAVLKSIAATLETLTGSVIPIHAQDPTYNDLDEQLLSYLGYNVARDPLGFDLIAAKSLVYTPGAEFHVEMAVITRQPAVLLTGKLDWYWRNSRGIACTNRTSLVQQEKNNAALAAKETGGDVPVPEDFHEEQCQLFESFRQSKAEALIPTFDDKDYPFYRQYLYWPKSPDGSEANVSNDLPALAVE